MRGLAKARGVSGSASNLGDGSMESIFEGPPGAVEELIAYCAEGPEGADVSRLDVVEEHPEGLEGFTIT